MINKKDKLEIKNQGKDVSHHLTLVISNLLAILFLTYFVVFYMKNEVNLLADATTSSTAVLGVTETILDNNEIGSNKDLVYTKQAIPPQNTIQNEVYYSEGMVRKLEDKEGFKGRIVVVND